MLLKRILAFMIDYMFIVLYASALYGAVSFLDSFFSIQSIIENSPFKGQLVGFITMTVPVVSYFIIFEGGSRRATIGKRILKLYVKVASNHRDLMSIVKRNVIKFFPWEIAHLGIHWSIYYNRQHIEPPLWVWVTLIVPQLIIVVYFVSIIIDREGRSVYDKVSHTKVSPLKGNRT